MCRLCYLGLICHGIVPSTTFCQTLFGCEIASASLVQPIIIVYLPAVATTIFTPKTHPKHSIWSNHPTKITTHLYIHFVLFPKWTIFKKPILKLCTESPCHQLSSARPCHPAIPPKAPRYHAQMAQPRPVRAKVCAKVLGNFDSSNLSNAQNPCDIDIINYNLTNHI